MKEATRLEVNAADELDDLIEELLEWADTPFDAFLLGVRVGSSALTLSDLILRAHSTDGGDIWTGTGDWEGWRLTVRHAYSDRDEPVLVAPDGTAYGPGYTT